MAWYMEKHVTLTTNVPISILIPHWGLKWEMEVKMQLSLYMGRPCNQPPSQWARDNWAHIAYESHCHPLGSNQMPDSRVIYHLPWCGGWWGIISIGA